MTLQYEDIYGSSYVKRYDPNFYKDKEFAYEQMKEWLHDIAGIPYIRKKFDTLSLDDNLCILTYTLTNSVDEDSDKDFVKKMFADGLVICWMKPQVDTVVNLATVIGDKETKRLVSNYTANVNRLESLQNKHRKFVRDYGYLHNNYVEET